MSTDRDVITRIVRSWLHEDGHEDADRILNLVLDEIGTTPQRRANWLARRFPVMNSSIVRIAAAAVVVALVVVIGIAVLAGPNVGQPGPSPSQSTMPSAIATPSATPKDFGRYPNGTALAAGSYVFTHVEPLRVSFTVPSGWEKGVLDWVVWSRENTKATLAVMSVDNLYVDPCRPDSGLRDPVVGPTAADLATALGTVPGVTFSTPADVTLAGFAGKYLEYVPPDTFGDCAASTLLWSVNGGVDDQPAPTGDDVLRLWILDVDGTRLVIAASAPRGVPEGRMAELQAIIDSIQIE
jgi:hypothetical protein